MQNGKYIYKCCMATWRIATKPAVECPVVLQNNFKRENSNKIDQNNGVGPSTNEKKRNQSLSGFFTIDLEHISLIISGDLQYSTIMKYA